MVFVPLEGNSPYLLAMIIIPAIININTTITNGIQIGANTHNQDHVMYPVSFNAINKIANNPENPIPELVVELLLSDISLNLKVYKSSRLENRTLLVKAYETFVCTSSTYLLYSGGCRRI